MREKRLSFLSLVAGWSRRWPWKAANQDKPKTGRGNPWGHQLNLSKQAEQKEIQQTLTSIKPRCFHFNSIELATVSFSFRNPLIKRDCPSLMSKPCYLSLSSPLVHLQGSHRSKSLPYPVTFLGFLVTPQSYDIPYLVPAPGGKAMAHKER